MPHASPQTPQTSLDPVYQEEQGHLSDVYQKLLALRDELTKRIEVGHKAAARDLISMSEEVTQDFGGADETMETLAAIETLNSVIDAYNQAHDFDVERLGRVMLLLSQPYFAKVRLRMAAGGEPRDIYIGAVGVTDEHHTPLVVDWRNPIAETYYNQQMGPCSYIVNGNVRTAEMLLRRQFDITKDHLNGYFDTTVAIQDSLLLSALRHGHTEKLRAITATIQREQNAVVRHEDVPVLLVGGIAGSGKTSVLLQRVAFLLYQERGTLDASQLYLFTPNDVFQRYIDTVLPSLGERNPQTFTWRQFFESLGQAERPMGEDTDPVAFTQLEGALRTLELNADDFSDIRVDGLTLVRAAQIKRSCDKFPRAAMGPRRMALVKEELHEKLDRKLTQMAKDEDVQNELLALDLDEQLRIFGEMIDPDPADQKSVIAFTRRYVGHRYAAAHDVIESNQWLRIDHIGQRILHEGTLTAVEWLYLELLLTGGTARDARFVMVDEVQDYTVAQLMLLARYFAGAHFLLLGDENQAIREGTATFAQIREIFERTHGSVDELSLRTSYRSSPKITELFSGLLDECKRGQPSSVQRDSDDPVIRSCPSDGEGYVRELKAHIAAAQARVDEAAARGEDYLAAVITADRPRANWLRKQLGEQVLALRKGEGLPSSGVILLDLHLAKGLEFDEVIVPDAQAGAYPDIPLARRRLYTAISRAMHRVCVLSQGAMTPLLDGVSHASADNR